MRRVYGEWGGQRGNDGSPSERSGASTWHFQALRGGADGSEVQENCGVASYDVVLCSAPTTFSRCWTSFAGGASRRAGPAQAGLTTGAIMVALLCEGMATEAYEVIVVWVNPVNTDAGHVIRVTEK